MTSSRECPQQVVRVGLVVFGERHGTWTNGQTGSTTPQQAAGRSSWQSASQAGRGSRPTRPTSKDVTRMLRGNCSRGISALPAIPTDCRPHTELGQHLAYLLKSAVRTGCGAVRCVALRCRAVPYGAARYRIRREQIVSVDDAGSNVIRRGNRQ